MRYIKQFFTWWFGELREIYEGRGKPPVALLLANREIGLLERGSDEAVEVVDLDAADRRTRIEVLRSVAEQRSGGVAAVEVRLPMEQVHFATLPANLSLENGAEAELARQTTLEEETLLITSSAVRRNASGTNVRDYAVTLRTSVADALKHARDWGFFPARVTSSHWPTSFPDGPNFLSSRVKRKTSLRRKLIIASLIIVPFGVAATGAHLLAKREAIAASETQRALALPAAGFDRGQEELMLAERANLYSAPVEARTDATPLWYVFGTIGEALPDDVAIDELVIEDREIRIIGTGVGYDSFIGALQAAPEFEATALRDSRAQGARASFVIDTTLSGREGL